jgi:hypothetical protein
VARLKILSLFCCCFLFLVSLEAFGYSNFIGYGYTSCVTCHFNAFGNGPLNDYGRAISATVISGRLFNSSKTTDETLAERSGFLGSAKLPYWWRPSISYRQMLVAVPGINHSMTTRNIIMQGDFSNVLKFGRHDDFLVVATIGYAPTPRGASPSDEIARRNLISREHYVAARVSRRVMIYAGMMDKVFGLRVPDHTAFSRLETGNSQNDQVHGVVAHISSTKYELGIHGFAGNLIQDAPSRTVGGSTLFEYETGEKTRLGASSLFMKNAFIQHTLAAIHLRQGIEKGSSIITEFGIDSEKPLVGTNQINGYNFTQGMLAVFPGFHFLTSLEFFTRDISQSVTQQFRFSPGFQYFPMQRVEIRFDARNTRFFDPDAVQPDSWDFLGQVHLWL